MYVSINSALSGLCPRFQSGFSANVSRSVASVCRTRVEGRIRVWPWQISGRVFNGYARVCKSSHTFVRIRNGFATGSRKGSRRIREDMYSVHDGFARIRKQIRESSREFAKVRESSREFARVRERYTDRFTTDIRRIRGLTQIREWIHSGFTRVLTQCSQFTAVNPSMAFDKSLIVFPIYFMGDVVE